MQDHNQNVHDDIQSRLRGDELAEERHKSRKTRRAEKAISNRVIRHFVKKAQFRSKRKADKGL